MAYAVGIDRRGQTRIAVWVRRGGRSRSILPSPEAIPRGALVAASISARTAVTVWLKAPFNNRRKAMRVVPALLDVELPFPLDSCAWTVVAERATAESRDLLAVAARQTDIHQRLAELAADGIDPDVLDHEGVAIWSQSIEAYQRGVDERYRAVCYLHAEGAVLALGEAGVLRGVYTVPHAGRDQLERLFVSRFGRDWRDRSDPAGSVVFFVCGPSTARQDSLREELDLPASVNWIVPDHPESFLALALAVRAVRNRAPLACNLRCGEMAHPRAVRREKRALQFAWLMLLAGGLLAGVAGIGARRVARQRLDALNRTFVAEATRIAGYPVASRGRDAVNEVSAAAADRLVVAPVFRRQLEPSLLPVLQRILHGVVAQEGVIERAEVGMTEVKLAVRVKDREALSRLLDQWSDAGLIPEREPVTKAVAEGLAVELVLMRRGS